MQDDPRYLEAWDSYRLWRRLSMIAQFGLLPWGVCVALCQATFKLGNDLGVALITPWFAFIPISWLLFVRWRCPRCGEPFCTQGPFRPHPWSVRECQRCRLPRWSTHDPDAKP